MVTKKKSPKDKKLNKYIVSTYKCITAIKYFEVMAEDEEEAEELALDLLWHLDYKVEGFNKWDLGDFGILEIEEKKGE